jgi:hypothetical protein
VGKLMAATGMSRSWVYYRLGELADICRVVQVARRVARHRRGRRVTADRPRLARVRACACARWARAPPWTWTNRGRPLNVTKEVMPHDKRCGTGDSGQGAHDGRTFTAHGENALGKALALLSAGLTP